MNTELFDTSVDVAKALTKAFGQIMELTKAGEIVEGNAIDKTKTVVHDALLNSSLSREQLVTLSLPTLIPIFLEAIQKTSDEVKKEREGASHAE